MRASRPPLVQWLVTGSPGDRIFDAFMMLGPVLVLLVVLVGRNVITIVLATLYVLGLFSYAVFNGIAQ